MDQEYHIECLSPFSPMIIKGQMPQHAVESLNFTIDSILGNSQECIHRDWSGNLAGNLKREVRITDILEDNLEMLQFLIYTARKYVLACSNALIGQTYGQLSDTLSFNLKLQDAWVNEMVAGDFNPVHFHSNCQLSCVGFLRIPDDYDIEFVNDKRNKNSVGCLQFIDSRTVMGASNMYMVRPSVGKFYIFPSWMLHCVYPFRSEGIRRSFSANLSITAGNK